MKQLAVLYSACLVPLVSMAQSKQFVARPQMKSGLAKMFVGHGFSRAKSIVKTKGPQPLAVVPLA